MSFSHQRFLKRPRLVLRFLLLGILCAGGSEALAAESLFETTCVFPLTPKNKPNYRIPALLQAPNGDVLVFAEKRNDGPGDIGNHDIVLKRSRDKGKTWSAEQVVLDDEDRVCTDITVGLDRSKEKLWLFFLRDKKKFAYLTSTDSGATWKGPVSIHDQVTKPEWDKLTSGKEDGGADPSSGGRGAAWAKGWSQRYGVGPGNAVVQIRSGPKAGRLVVPARHREDLGKGRLRSFAHCFYSDDHGATWKLGGSIGLHTSEGQLVELADGDLMAVARNESAEDAPDNLRHLVARSRDGGETWGPVRRAEELITPRCHGAVERFTLASTHGKNRLLFSSPASPFRQPEHPYGRYNLTIRLSYDEGATWTAGKTIWPHPASYSDVVVLDDMTVGYVYERGDKGSTHYWDEIHFARFNLEWLTDGRDSLSALKGLKLPALFSDHMVFQAGAVVPVWGWAAPGEQVTVSLAGQTRTVQAAPDGKWLVQLNQLKPTKEPQTLTVKGRITLTVKDVLVGEVWLASGQSNMALKVESVNHAAEETAAAQFPALRMFTVTSAAAAAPQEDCKGSWQVCTPQTARLFSATAYFFGRELHKTLDVPVGLINSSVGGTPIESWISPEAQKASPELKAHFEEQLKAERELNAEAARAKYERDLSLWTEAARKAQAEGKAPPVRPRDPIAFRKKRGEGGRLFNGKIAPLVPFALRGAVWYQGEANSAPAKAPLYQHQLPLLIQDWRGRWGYEFPFAWVQLPNFDGGDNRDWPLMREAMLHTLKVNHTGMAITIDIGEADNIHPKNKQDVGRRLALWALGTVYARPVPATSGPLPDGHQIRGSEVVLRFKHTEGGLVAKGGGDPKGFEIAGADQQWKPAQAKITGNQVIASHADVKQPVAVRYAWANNPDGNLCNGAGLPASPFRTDVPARGKVKLPAIFSEHMVVQADKPVAVWGWAEPGEDITVSLAGQAKTARAGADGRWRVTLDSLKPVSEPQTLTVRGKDIVTVNDVLVGEVWLCAGQSNMEMQIKGLHGQVDRADEEIAAANHPRLRMFVHDQGYNIYELPAPPEELMSDRPGEWLVCSPRTAARFSALGFFFGRDLHQELRVPVGLINCSVGGTPIEAWTSLEAQRAEPALRPVLDDWQQRFAKYDPERERKEYVQAKERWLKQRAAARASGQEPPKAPAAFKNLRVMAPGGLFNGLIAPITPATVRGVIWYQGERNAAGPLSKYYGVQLQALIRDWRVRWGDEFYFAWVQLPRFQKEQKAPSEPDGWGVAVREEMRKALSLPRTGMAVTIDLGGARDGHPTNKADFARRLSLLALHDVYGKPLPLWCGPLFRSARREADTMVITFEHATGLKSSSKELEGFAIAGSDRQFVWAKGKIVDGKVIVWSDSVREPAAVRYGWASNPKCTLVNGAGLPASPFRSDDWP